MFNIRFGVLFVLYNSLPSADRCELPHPYVQIPFLLVRIDDSQLDYKQMCFMFLSS